MSIRSFFQRPAPLSEPKKLYYKSELDFFESQCEFGFTEIKKNHAIVALVIDARKELGTDSAVSIGKDGSQLAALRVASPDGGFLIFASTPSRRGERLKPGNLVHWVPYEYSEAVGSQTTDSRTGWVGLIRAKLKPEVLIADQSIVLSCRYD